MFRRVSIPFLALVALGLTSCGSGRYSASGFRLPSDGNVERGKAAFLAFGCHTRHVVPGSDLPRPTVQPPVPVRLGVMVTQPIADGYLVTPIIRHTNWRTTRRGRSPPAVNLGCRIMRTG